MEPRPTGVRAPGRHSPLFGSTTWRSLMSIAHARRSGNGDGSARRSPSEAVLASAMAWLVVEGAQGGQSCEIGASVDIGRSRDCALRLQDSNVSKLHCTVRSRGVEIWIQDQGSTNGTQVN